MSAPVTSELNALHNPVPADDFLPIWMVKNLLSEEHYRAEVEGSLPIGLRGTLYRNGPGLFQRDSKSKANALDGDGLIQSFRFDEQGVYYRSRFVRTEKFIREEAEQKFIYPTWTTRSDSWWRNILGNGIKSQAGVVVNWHHNKLYAIDERSLPYELNPDTLETLGEAPIFGEHNGISNKAHNKLDQKTGDWVFLSVDHRGANDILKVFIRNKHGQSTLVRKESVGGNFYIHDFFVTKQYVVVNIQPLKFNFVGFLFGTKSYRDCLSWRGDLGNKIWLIPKDAAKPARCLDASAKFMWHVFNAYETGNKIIADFIGYDSPDHFLGKGAHLEAVMQGNHGSVNDVGRMIRYEIDVLKNSLTEQRITNELTYEFPTIDPHQACYAHRYGYATVGHRAGLIHEGLAKIDFKTGETQHYFFPDSYVTGEPFFVKDATKPAGREDDGFIISLVLDGGAAKSFLAIFRAENLLDGPIAKVWLKHHSPLTFHGCFIPLPTLQTT